MKLKLLTLAAILAGGVFSELKAQVIAITNGVYLQNFDTLGATGTNTPAGWLVSWASGTPPVSLVAPTRQLTAGDGSAAPSGTVAGWNYGNSGSTERSLGTAPTSTGAPTGGGGRAIIAQFRNTSGAPIESLSLYYDGEQWRTGSSTSTTNRYVVQYSTDGTNYVDLGPAFNFTQPVMSPVNTRLDGNLAANRVSSVGGLYTPASPIAANQAFYLRWYDENEGGTDPALAIDNVFLFQGDTLFQITSPATGQTNIAGVPLNIAVAASPDVIQVAFYIDDMLVEVDEGAPFGFQTNGLPAGAHNVRAEGTLAGGGVVNAGPVNFTVVANQAPQLVITNSYSPPLGTVTFGTNFLVGSSITFQATASDDVGLQSVDWYIDGEPYVRRTNASFNFIYADSRVGSHTIHGVVTDLFGLTTTSPAYRIVVTNPPAHVELLITNHSVWRYHAANGEPAPDGNGLAWYQPGYDAEEWPAGEGELGYGDTADGYPEQTVIDGGPATNRFRTVYFRHTFVLADTDFVGLSVRVMRDDGAVVYVNGQSVWTNNITATPITYDTLAAQAADEGLVYTVTNIPPSLVVVGENVVAVEVHQNSATSSDLSFDLMLWGDRYTPPTLVITSPTNGVSVVASSDVTVTTAAGPFVTNVVFTLDGAPAGSDAMAPFGTVLADIGPGPHVLVAVGLDSLGNSVTSAPVQFTATVNQGPVVRITNIFSGSITGFTYLVGAPITNQVFVSDDVRVASVSLLVDGTNYFTRTNGTLTQFIVIDNRAGSHTVQALATDNAGLTAVSETLTVVFTNPPAALLLTNGSDWRYYNAGAAPTVDGLNLTWTESGYDDETWPVGQGEIGFGDIAEGYVETTVIDGGPGTNRNRTVYFRRTFHVADPTAFTNLVVNLLRDDGGIVYLNGVEVYRTGMPAGTVTYDTFASGGAADDGTVYHVRNVSPAALVAGENTIAVEVHQSAANSSDLSFDAMLWGQGSVVAPTLSIVNDGTRVVVSWSGPGFTLLQSEQVEAAGDLWVPVPGNPQNTYEIVLPPGTPTLFFRLKSN